jgi:hypothetical protein
MVIKRFHEILLSAMVLCTCLSTPPSAGQTSATSTATTSAAAAAITSTTSITLPSTQAASPPATTTSTPAAATPPPQNPSAANQQNKRGGNFPTQGRRGQRASRDSPYAQMPQTNPQQIPLSASNAPYGVVIESNKQNPPPVIQNHYQIHGENGRRVYGSYSEYADLKTSKDQK